MCDKSEEKVEAKLLSIQVHKSVLASWKLLVHKKSSPSKNVGTKQFFP